jgi:hypothetical protein
MTEKEMREFSWPTLFFVTGFSFFLFGGVLKFLNSSHIKYFMFAGLLAMFLGTISGIGKVLVRSDDSRSKKRRDAVS